MLFTAIITESSLLLFLNRVDILAFLIACTFLGQRPRVFARGFMASCDFDSGRKG